MHIQSHKILELDDVFERSNWPPNWLDLNQNAVSWSTKTALMDPSTIIFDLVRKNYIV